MTYKKTPLTEQNIFQGLHEQGEAGAEIVASAERLFAAANAGAENQQRTEAQYVAAVRLGQSVLSGERVHVDYPEIAEDAAYVLGSLRHLDRLRSGVNVHKFVGLRTPETMSATVGNMQYKYDENNAILQAGRIWSGSTEKANNPEAIRRAREALGEVLVRQMGPDLGYNMLAICYRTTSPAALMVDSFAEHLPPHVLEGVKHFYKNKAVYMSQLVKGREVLASQLALEPTFAINQERLLQTMQQWQSSIESHAQKLQTIAKLYYATSRELPAWVQVAQNALLGTKPALADLPTAYNMYQAAKELTAFEPEQQGFKMFLKIINNQWIVGILKDAFAQRSGSSPQALIFAEALQRGQTVEEALTLIPGADKKTIVGQTVSFIERALSAVPVGTDKATAVKLINNKPVSPRTAAEPKTPKKPQQPKQPKNTPESKPIVAPQYVTEDQLRTWLSAKELNNLTAAANKRKVSLPALVNEALRRRTAANSDIVIKILEALASEHQSQNPTSDEE